MDLQRKPNSGRHFRNVENRGAASGGPERSFVSAPTFAADKDIPKERPSKGLVNIRESKSRRDASASIPNSQLSGSEGAALFSRNRLLWRRCGPNCKRLPHTPIGIFSGTSYSAHSGLIRWRLRCTANRLGAVRKYRVRSGPTHTWRRPSMLKPTKSSIRLSAQICQACA